MTLTLCQEWLIIFCQKAQHFVQFGLYDFVQILPTYGSNTWQISMERLYTSDVSIRNSNIKYLIGKSNFAVDN